MNNYIINTLPNAKSTFSSDYHFYKMHEPATPTITLTLSPTKQMKKFMNRMKGKYERNERDNHFIFQVNYELLDSFVPEE